MNKRGENLISAMLLVSVMLMFGALVLWVFQQGVEALMMSVCACFVAIIAAYLEVYSHRG